MSRAFLSCRPQPRRLMRMAQCKHGADVSALPSLTVARQPSRLDRQQVRHATDQPPHLEDHFAGPDQLLARLDVGGRSHASHVNMCTSAWRWYWQGLSLRHPMMTLASQGGRGSPVHAH